MIRLVLQKAERDLFQMIQALGSPCRLAGRLHGRQQQGNQDADDRNDDQQFHQRKSTLGSLTR